jgi:hypothetical protein
LDLDYLLIFLAGLFIEGNFTDYPTFMILCKLLFLALLGVQIISSNMKSIGNIANTPC